MHCLDPKAVRKQETTSLPKHQQETRRRRDYKAMARLIKAFVATLLLSLFTKGLCDCSLDNINIGTVRSGRQISGKPEWNVTVTNNCQCAQSQIKLSCSGFQTTENVDPSIFVKQGDTCLLINGNSLQASASVKFSYAWDPPFLLLPVSSVTHGC